MRDKSSYKILLDGYLNSYTQVFFSTSKIFASILVIITFFNLVAGISGLVAVMVANILAYLAGFNRTFIKNGFYGFNSLLVALGLGVFFQPGPEYFVVLLFASMLTLFFTVLMEGVIGKYGLPYMSVPFLLGIWFVTLASRTYGNLELSETGIYTLNEMYTLGGLAMVNAWEWFGDLNWPGAVETYFRSLGAIFFQYHLFPGILVAVGLLIYSRIAFVLSLLGFFSAWAFYQLMGADMTELNYAYIGFNFILTAIAVGGYFIIPSVYSYGWVVLLTPLIAIILSATNSILYVWQLPVYSLPFNVIVLVFLYILKFRQKHLDKPSLILVQHHTPEKNLYYHLSHARRFGKNGYTPLSLPFYGKWTVTQGHDGEITHKEHWKYAWDFEIQDEDGKTYRGSGDRLQDYHCFGKPVLAPADGYVEKVQDGIDDNAVGEVNLVRNWGNAVVIRHSEKFYSLLCHLGKGSVSVKPGEFVKKGTAIGLCGNSGRSPYPHLHFQVQENPQIGAATSQHSLSHYILEEKSGPKLVNSGIPAKGQVISNIAVDGSLKKAFGFVPGQEIVVCEGESEKAAARWEIKADVFNNTFIECLDSGSRAYFRNMDELFYFSSFRGSKDTVLYNFFLAAYKVIYGYRKGLKISDDYPLHLFSSPWERLLQDFVAPFRVFLRSEYTADYSKDPGSFDENNYDIVSVSRNTSLNKVRKEWKSEVRIEKSRVTGFSVKAEGREKKEYRVCETF